MDSFYDQFSPRFYKKGEVLIRSDDDPQGIFCLKSGLIRQYIISKSGMELTIQILKPISYFPLVWAINNTPNIYYYEALTESEVGRAPRKELLSYIKDKPDVIFNLMSEQLEDYTETLTRIEHLVFSDAYRRVISVLIYLAKDFGEEQKGKIIVKHRFTQQDIASLVGVARETVSNEMAKIEKGGFLKYDEHAMIFQNLEKLESELIDSQ